MPVDPNSESGPVILSATEDDRVLIELLDVPDLQQILAKNKINVC